MVPKNVAVRGKTSSRSLAARRLVPRYATNKIVIGIQVVAKLAGSEDPVFTWVRYSTVWAVALKRPNFKRKKGSRTSLLA
jgi:hypothetical protein